MSDVSALITAAQGYTNTLVSQASGAMLQATAAVSNTGYLIPTYEAAELPQDPPGDIDTEIPDLEPVLFEAPIDPPGPPTFGTVSMKVPEGGFIPPKFDEPKPVLELPTKPSTVAPFLERSPTIDTSFEFPEPPDQLLHPNIPEPTLPNRNEPTKPQVMLPGFEGVRPTLDAVAPTDLEQTLSASYSTAAPSFVAAIDGYVDAMLAKHNPQYHTQMAALEGQLTKYLQGGTGLNAAVEDAIYERSRSKQSAEANRVRDAAWGDAAARGFTLPTGALMSAVQTARQAAADNNAASAREIVVMQAEMEQKNLQFAVTTSTALRTTILNATLSYMQNLVSLNGQALDYAKNVLNAIVETYNIAVKAFSAKLDGYKADAQVFEVKLRGAMAAIELYKAEIDALQALTNVDKAKVDVYRARIDALTSLANVYRAQIEAVQGRASLEKLKLDVFQSQVQSYTSLVQAKNSEWQGYAAAVQGQESKVKIFSAMVDAYRGRIDGYRAEIDAHSEEAKAVALSNQAKADQHRAILDHYKAVIQTKGEVARYKIESQSQELNAFQAKMNAEVSNAQVKQAYYKATADVAIANADGALKAQISEGSNRTNYGHALASTATANAQIFGNLASSAMAGMNTLVSQSATE